MAVKHMLNLLCFVVLFACSPTEVLENFARCGMRGTLQQVRVVPCPAVPCILKHDTNMAIEIDFLPDIYTESLHMAMFGIIEQRLEVKWNLVPIEACPNITDCSGKTVCPIDPFEVKNVTYRNTFDIKRIQPTIPLVIKVLLSNPKNNQPIICFKFDAVIIYHESEWKKR